MSKTIKFCIIMFVSAMFVLLLYTYNSVYGEEISEDMAKNIAIEYVEEKYSGEGFELRKGADIFKLNEYYVIFAKKNSKDKHFAVTIDKKRGHILDDSHESIANGRNTSARLGEEYFNYIYDYLERIVASYKIQDVYENDSFMTCQLIFNEHLKCGKYKILNERDIKISDLEVDKEYDMAELSKKLGLLTAVIYSKDISVDNTCEIALKVKNDLAKENIEFQELELNLCKFIPEEDKETTEEESLKFTISYDKICDDKVELKKSIENLINEQYDYYHPKKN